MSLTSRILGLLLACSGDLEPTRLLPVADAIVDAAGAYPSFGDRTADALAAIGCHESRYRERVRRCHETGDRGRSVGAYQLMRGMAWAGHSRAEICESDELQARLAAQVLWVHRGRCQACGPGFLFRAYASGDGGKKSDAAARIENIWRSYEARLPANPQRDPRCVCRSRPLRVRRGTRAPCRRPGLRARHRRPPEPHRQGPQGRRADGALLGVRGPVPLGFAVPRGAG